MLLVCEGDCLPLNLSHEPDPSSLVGEFLPEVFLALFKVNPTKYSNQLGAGWVEVCACACVCVCMCIYVATKPSEENLHYLREAIVY